MTTCKLIWFLNNDDRKDVKEIVARDFLTLVFFMNHTHMDPWVISQKIYLHFSHLTGQCPCPCPCSCFCPCPHLCTFSNTYVSIGPTAVSDSRISLCAPWGAPLSYWQAGQGREHWHGHWHRQWHWQDRDRDKDTGFYRDMDTDRDRARTGGWIQTRTEILTQTRTRTLTGTGNPNIDIHMI
jgi:hypothetical protein